MKLVTHSSCESEYVGLSEAGNEAVYLQQLGDNESSLKLAVNPVFYQRSKHIRIKYHFLRDKVEEIIIELRTIDTGLHAADMMTENVGVGVLRKCEELVRMVASGQFLSIDVDGCCREGECGKYCNIIVY